MAVWGKVCDAFGQGGVYFWARFDFGAQALPEMPEEMAPSHGPTVTNPQTKTPRIAARRLDRKTRPELFLVIH